MNLHTTTTPSKVLAEAAFLLGSIIGMFWIGYEILMIAQSIKNG